MYRRILLALENTDSDEALFQQVPRLAGLLGSELVLLHVADGWAARNFDRLQLAASEEMKEDWAYLEASAARLKEGSGLTVTTHLAVGNPPDEIVKVAAEENCDLIVLVSHGHKLIGDIVYGSTINSVRHNSGVAVLAIPSVELPVEGESKNGATPDEA